MKKKILFLFIIFALALTGCKKEETEIGQINPISLKNNSETVQPFKSISTFKDETSDYTYNYGGFSFKFPSKMLLESGICNQIKISDDNAIIYIESIVGGNTKITNLQMLVDEFNSVLNTETYTFQDVMNVFRAEDQSGSIVKNEITTVRNKKVIFCKDFKDVILTSTAGEYICEKYGERRYYMRYKNVDTVISIVYSKDKGRKYRNIIDSLVSSISPVNEKIESIKTYKLKDVNFNLPVGYEYRKRDINKYTDCATYTNSITNNSSLAGTSFLTFTSSKLLDITSEELSLVIESIYEGTSSSISIIDNTNIMEDVDKGIISFAKADCLFYVNNDFTSRTGLWTIDVSLIDKNKEYQYILSIYPSNRKQQIKQLYKEIIK